MKSCLFRIPKMQIYGVSSKLFDLWAIKKCLFRKLYIITFEVLPVVLPLLVTPHEYHLWIAIDIRCRCSHFFFSRLKSLPFPRAFWIGEEPEVTRCQYESVGSLLNSGVFFLASKTWISGRNE